MSTFGSDVGVDKVDGGISDAIVFAVLDEDVVAPVGDQELLAAKFESDKVVAKTQFHEKFWQQIYESLGKESSINDATVICGGCSESGNLFRVPSVLLAAISPVFKASAGLSEAETYSIVLPDIDGNDFR